MLSQSIETQAIKTLEFVQMGLFSLNVWKFKQIFQDIKQTVIEPRHFTDHFINFLQSPDKMGVLKDGWAPLKNRCVV